MTKKNVEVEVVAARAAAAVVVVVCCCYSNLRLNSSVFWPNSWLSVPLSDNRLNLQNYASIMTCYHCILIYSVEIVLFWSCIRKSILSQTVARLLTEQQYFITISLIV